MLKTIRFTIFLFYNYYKTGKWESAPYFHSLASMSFLTMLNIATIFCLFNKAELIFVKKYKVIIALGIFLLLIFFYNLIASKNSLDNYKIDQVRIRKGNGLLILYLILSFSVLMYSMTFITKK